MADPDSLTNLSGDPGSAPRFDDRLRAMGDDVALLCFEPEGKFCHRSLVAKWLTDSGFPVVEYGHEPGELHPCRPGVERWSDNPIARIRPDTGQGDLGL